MAENNKNAKISKTNTSGFKGVSPSQTFGKWIASITIENKTKYLGTFKSRTDAAHAYDSYALEHYGEFAKPNFA